MGQCTYTCRNCLNCPNLMATAFPSESLIYFKPENANIPPPPSPSKSIGMQNRFFPPLLYGMFSFSLGEKCRKFPCGEETAPYLVYTVYISTGPPTAPENFDNKIRSDLYGTLTLANKFSILLIVYSKRKHYFNRV